jgi:uncharacterized membrane-anchored protein
LTPRVKRLFIAVIAVQIVFLLGIVGYRESILITGRTAVLQTVPVDPRDLFRGDFVVLRYEISTLRQSNTAPGQTWHVFDNDIKEGDTVYVGLPDSDGSNPPSQHVRADEPPADSDLYIRGTVTQRSGESMNVDYGIERYFVPEGRGLEIERADDVKVRVSINRSGTAAIKELIVDGEVWQR